MLIEPEALLQLLGVPAGTAVEVEPGGMYPSLVDRVTIGSGPAQQTVIVRSNMDPEMAQNQAAIVDVLTSIRYGPVPRVFAITHSVTVEEEVPAISGLALQMPPVVLEATIDALVELHELPLREGMRQGQPRDSVVEGELQLFRLGFASYEREAAAPHIAAAKDLLVSEAPFGFVHGECTAGHILAGAGRAWLVDFSNGGFGCQLFDVAAFLLTSGERPEVRERLAERYVQARGLPFGTAGLIEMSELLWGLPWLIGLSRRLVLAYEDAAVSSAFSLIASRIDRGMREGWGRSSLAEEIRHGLWPG